MHSCGPRYRPRSPEFPGTQRQEYTPREDVIKYVRRPGRILTPARVCVSHAKSSLREREFRDDCRSPTKKNSLCTNSASYHQLSSDSRRSLHRLDRLVTRSGVSATGKIQAPSSDFDGPGSSVTRNRHAFRRWKRRAKIRISFRLSSRGILYSIAVTSFSRMIRFIIK